MWIHIRNTVPFLLGGAANVDPNSITHSSTHALTIAGVALNGKRWQVVQLFYYITIDGFLLLPLWCSKCDTSLTPRTPRATRATNQNWRKQQIQPIRNKGKFITDAD
jgi:hypothetical protein